MSSDRQRLDVAADRIASTSLRFLPFEHSAQVEQHPPVLDARHHRRACRPVAARRGLRRSIPFAATEITAVGSGRSGSDPPPTNAESSWTSTSRPGTPRSWARQRLGPSANLGGRCSEHAQRRNLLERPVRCRRYSRSVASRAASVILSSRNARISGSFSIFWTSSFFPTMTPACGPPRSLSPLKRTRSAPVARLSPMTGSPGKPNRAKSIIAPLPTSSMTGRLCLRPSATSSSSDRGLGEPAHPVVAVVHPHQEGRVRADRLLVVADPGDVRGADFAERRAGDAHDLRDAKAAADLDQLPAGDDHFLPGGQGAQDDHGRGGAVVDGRRRLAAEQRAEHFADRVLPARALAGGEVEFEVQVAASGLVGGLRRGLGDGRAAEVGVQDDPGGVDDGPQVAGALPASTRAATRRPRHSSVQRAVEGLPRLQSFAQGIQFGPHRAIAIASWPWTGSRARTAGDSRTAATAGSCRNGLPDMPEL